MYICTYNKEKIHLSVSQYSTCLPLDLYQEAKKANSFFPLLINFPYAFWH
jgi:hypothetical protein